MCGRRPGTISSSCVFLALILQEELGKRQLDIKWDPLKGKKQLVDRLQVRGEA